MLVDEKIGDCKPQYSGCSFGEYKTAIELMDVLDHYFKEHPFVLEEVEGRWKLDYTNASREQEATIQGFLMGWKACWDKNNE